jgi:nitroreductase
MNLPKPKLRPGKSIAIALKERKTTRDISDKKLSLQMLSNVLWAACGVNRLKGPFGGLGITAASASNSQEISLHVATSDGAYRFDAEKHRLTVVSTEDLREFAISPGQKIAMRAPVQIIYVVDLHRLTHTSGFQEPGLHKAETQKSYYYVDTGLIAGNVYLFAASQGLAAWFHNCDREVLREKLKLRAEERVLFAQSVGYPRSTSTRPIC